MSDRLGLLTATDAAGTEWLIPVTLHGAYLREGGPDDVPIVTDTVLALPADPLDVGTFNDRGGLTVTDLKVVMG